MLAEGRVAHGGARGGEARALELRLHRRLLAQHGRALHLQPLEALFQRAAVVARVLQVGQQLVDGRGSTNLPICRHI